MIKLTTQKLNQLLLGVSLLSTGGGGSLIEAKKILRKIKTCPKLMGLSELNPNDVVVTVLGVGDKDVNNPVSCSVKSLEIFQKLFKQKIAAIIPIEIGPISTLSAIMIASQLNLPIIDTDIVGGRASPEVFLETITLANLSREPIVIANDKNDVLILYRSSSMETMEKNLRNFATVSGGDVYGVGYPLKVKQLKKIVGENTLSCSIKLGRDLNRLKNKQINLGQFCKKNDLIKLGQGKIIKTNLQAKNGFIKGEYLIKTNQGKILTIVIKNENIALLTNRKSILTVPDSLLLLDQQKFIGINNQNDNLNKLIIILGKKAIPIWRSKPGLKLFSPQKLGYNIKQVLL